MKRQGISKTKRFFIFSRDKFRCRYCGLESDRVTLVVDHVIPLSKGGTNDDANLITSCEDCNQGKSAKELGKIAPTTVDERRIQQELREQIAQAKIARAASMAITETDKLLCDFWCDQFFVSSISSETKTHLRNILNTNGSENLFRWIGIAANRHQFYSDSQRLRYIYGIRKKEMEVKP